MYILHSRYKGFYTTFHSSHIDIETMQIRKKIGLPRDIWMQIFNYISREQYLKLRRILGITLTPGERDSFRDILHYMPEWRSWINTAIKNGFQVLLVGSDLYKLHDRERHPIRYHRENPKDFVPVLWLLVARPIKIDGVTYSELVSPGDFNIEIPRLTRIRFFITGGEWFEAAINSHGIKIVIQTSSTNVPYCVASHTPWRASYTVQPFKASTS